MWSYYKRESFQHFELFYILLSTLVSTSRSSSKIALSWKSQTGDRKDTRKEGSVFTFFFSVTERLHFKSKQHGSAKWQISFLPVTEPQLQRKQVVLCAEPSNCNAYRGVGYLGSIFRAGILDHYNYYYDPSIWADMKHQLYNMVLSGSSCVSRGPC